MLYLEYKPKNKITRTIFEPKTIIQYGTLQPVKTNQLHIL